MGKERLTQIAFVAVSLSMFQSVPAHGETISGYARVIDGDTLVISKTHVRLAGIDAPEHNQLCDGQPLGAQASSYLRGLVEGRRVDCDVSTHDKYGRSIATCVTYYESGTVDISRMMVLGGYAFSYDHYSTKYYVDELRSIVEEGPVHKYHCMKPWEWRREHL